MTRWRPQVRPLHRPLKTRIRKGHPIGDGTRLEGGRAMSLAGSTPAPSAPPGRVAGVVRDATRLDALVSSVRPVTIDGPRGVAAAREIVDLGATGSTPAGHPRRSLSMNAEATMTTPVL